MNYRQAEEYILDIPKFSSKNTMEDTKAFLSFLGNPDREMKIIHVAGTNGKGSVCAFLTSILCEAGCHVGTFISPHLVTMRERFLIDKEMISEGEFLEAFLQVKEALENYSGKEGEIQVDDKTILKKPYHPSFFEYLFFMALLIFKKKNVDYVVLETGLGGRLDATNSVDKKLATVITSIGFDHMEYLGNTLTEIAGEKAGILRKNTPVIFSDKTEEVTKTILDEAKKVEALPIPVKKQEYKATSIFRAGIDFSCHSNYYGDICFHADSAGIYQAENAALAIKTLETIGYENLNTDRKITVEILQKGISATYWAARMEEIFPNVFLDGAHNTDGIGAFIESVLYTSPNKKRILLYSVVKDKQYEAVLCMLAKSGAFEQIGVVKMNDKRGLDTSEMEQILGDYRIPFKVYDSLDAAMDETLAATREEDCVAYIAGSLYLAGEVKAWIKAKKNA